MNMHIQYETLCGALAKPDRHCTSWHHEKMPTVHAYRFPLKNQKCFSKALIHSLLAQCCQAGSSSQPILLWCTHLGNGREFLAFA